MHLHILRQHREAIAALATRFHAQNVRVFGSVARGDNRPESDVDFLVHFLPQASLLDEVALARELGALLGARVDLIGDDAIREELKPFILSEATPL